MSSPPASSRPEPEPTVRDVRPVNLVENMPEIAYHLSADEHGRARRELVARSYVIEKGRWRPRLDDPGPGHLGLLVVGGLLTRDVVMQETLACELVGRGDLLRVHDADGEDAPIPFDVAWHVADSARIAVLDAAFARRAGQWPSIVEFVVKAISSRAHSLAVSMAISRLRHVELRVLVLLWYLADRWGHVRPDGVHVPLELTHETIARLVGSRRPSVTTAVTSLTRQGKVSRTPGRQWVLHGDPPAPAESDGRLRERAPHAMAVLADDSTVDHHVDR